ncbi:hypothetical protein [Natrinema sp. CGMCC1.2065]|uniref:hypothetical protein n=1 Tax=Natrinema sp. CGMCC1.2065 TaxID=3445767 RepID=UPI003F4A1977
MNDEPRTKECPSPDCDVELPIAKLATHVNEEHPGEYRRDDWPDTEVGHEARVEEVLEDNDDGE